MRNHATFLLSAITIGAGFSSGSVHSQPLLPDFGAATFEPGTQIDNPYFPLDYEGTRVFKGETEENGETATERFELTVTGPGRKILGVQTTAQRDRSFEDGLLVEDTFDYFAQDTGGTVWYFGEDVTNYEYDEEGNLIGTNDESAWIAGENLANPGGEPAQPGWIMPALPTALTDGLTYFQEFAPDDEAVDVGEHILPLTEISVEAGEFSDVLRVLDTSPLEPDARDLKYYAPGIGLVAEDEGVNLDLEGPELRFELVSSIEEPVSVPEPETITLMATGLIGLFAAHRRRRSSEGKSI